MSIKAILGDPLPFFKSLMAELNQAGIKVAPNAIDHICYKVETNEEYEALKLKLEKVGQLLAEAQINKRPIATFELHSSLSLLEYKIPLLELAAPKPGIFKKSHYEHFEVILNDEPLAHFWQKYPALKWDISKIHDTLNPDITVLLSSGLVKFHPTSLKQVIEKEKSLK